MSVVLYTVPNCPLCESARNALKSASIEFVERDIVNEFSARRRVFRATKQNLVPVVEVNETFFVRPTVEQIRALAI